MQSAPDSYSHRKKNIYLVLRKLFISATLVLFMLVSPHIGYSQQSDTLSSSQKLKKLSLEELMDIDVTSISMRSEKITEVPSAVQVITAENIYRSSATRLPEALRLVSNLSVGQGNSHDWSITSRGFNGLPSGGGVLANKLLVMMDGRSVYNPLYGGVFWDVQNTMLSDLDRIEVVSGPGGTIWGANAVNGVINIITKSAKETQGAYVSGASGTFLKDQLEARYGFQFDSTLYVRVYGQRFDQRGTDLFVTGLSSKDAWHSTQGGMRMDYYPTSKTSFTLQGDVYAGRSNENMRRTLTDGQNILARYNHSFSEASNLKIQFYFDRTNRHIPNSVPRPDFYELNSYQLDIEDHFPLGERQVIVAGATYRFQHDNIADDLTPLSRNMPLYSAYLQDEIALVPQKLKFTIGSKFLNNIYTGFEFQPTSRLAWTPTENHTLWGAASRAVRTPTRLDADLNPGGNINFNSEKVNAFEMGYRVRPLSSLFLSAATFFNNYDDLRSFDSVPGSKTAFFLANNQRAESWGFELSGNYEPTEWWKVRGGYTYFKKVITPVSPLVNPVSVLLEGIDATNMVMLQSSMDFYNALQFDLIGRYVDYLPGLANVLADVPSYITFDARLAWRFKYLEISLVGQNLIKDFHTETGASKIPRSIYGKLTCRF